MPNPGEGGSRSGSVPIDLSEQGDFTLGCWQVRPSLRIVRTADGEHRIEPRLMQVLVVLAQADGATVSRDSLIRSCWSGLAVGDDAVNRVIAALRSLAARSGAPFRIETIARVGFRLIKDESFSAGFNGPGWAGATASSSLGRWMVRAGLTLAAVLFAVLIFGEVDLRARSDPAERLAILEFSTTPPSVQDGDFPSNLAARIRQVMSANDLQIIARPDARGFHGPDMVEAARRDNVGYVLDGGVTHEPDGDLVVRAELIDARNNLTLWSHEFRRSESESIYMLDQIAIHSAWVLRCALISRRARSGPQDSVALTAFLEACNEVNRYDGGGDEALESIRAVTRQVPEYSRGWSMLALSAATASGYSDGPAKAALQAEARTAIRRARELDRSNPEPYLAEAELLPNTGAYRKAEMLIGRALALDPNYPDALAMLGQLYLVTGRMADAVAMFRRAAAADPLSPMNQTNLVPALSGQGKQAQAAAIRDQLYRVWPGSPRVWMHRLHNAAFPGTPEDAAEVLDEIDAAPIKFEADVVAAFRRYLAAKVSGDELQRRRAAERYVELALQGRFDLAPAFSALAEIGEVDRAFALARLYLRQQGGSSWPLFGPATVQLRRDPRFIGLAGEIGLVDYWQASNAWPDFCADRTLSYDCREQAAKIGQHSAP